MTSMTSRGTIYKLKPKVVPICLLHSQITYFSSVPTITLLIKLATFLILIKFYEISFIIITGKLVSLNNILL